MHHNAFQHLFSGPCGEPEEPRRSQTVLQGVSRGVVNEEHKIYADLSVLMATNNTCITHAQVNELYIPCSLEGAVMAEAER